MFNNIVKREYFLPVLVLLLVFIVSLLFFIIEKGKYSRRIYFFPESISKKLVKEDRYIQKRNNLENSMETFIEELILGSIKPRRSNLFPKGTQLLSLNFQDNILYINFSENILFKDLRVPYNLQDIFQSVINNIVSNFSNIKSIYFFINGEIPFFLENDESTGIKPQFSFSLIK